MIQTIKNLPAIYTYKVLYIYTYIHTHTHTHTREREREGRRKRETDFIELVHTIMEADKSKLCRLGQQAGD